MAMHNRSRLFALLLMVALLLPPAAARAQTTDQTQVINVDTPAANATVSGVVTVSGWAIDPTAPSGTGIDQVHVYVDGEAGQGGRLLGAAKYGNRRPDVASARGGERFAPSGFEYSWDTLSVAPGVHTLYVYAHNPAGDWGYTSVPVTVSPNRNAPQPGGGTAPPAGGTGTTPPSTGGTGTAPPSTGGAGGTPPATGGTGARPPANPPATGSRVNPSANLPAATPGLPKIQDHPTDDNIGQVVAMTPPPPGIRWSDSLAEFDEEDEVPIVLLGLLDNDRANTWLKLPVEQQEAFLRQFLVNLGETYVNEDSFIVIVALRMQSKDRADIPDFVPDRYVRRQDDGSYRATWPDVVGAYIVPQGRVLFKSVRMSEPQPSITK